MPGDSLAKVDSYYNKKALRHYIFAIFCLVIA